MSKKINKRYTCFNENDLKYGTNNPADLVHIRYREIIDVVQYKPCNLYIIGVINVQIYNIENLNKN